MDDATKARFVEAGARAIHEHRRRLFPLVVSFGWYDIDPEDQRALMAEARACLSAALAVAEQEGVIFTRLPEREPDGARTDAVARWRDGYNAAIAATLAAKVTL
jgi:hypothetical protein